MMHWQLRASLAPLLVILSLSLGGCVKLGAEPLDFDCTGSQLSPYLADYSVSPVLPEIQRDATDFARGADLKRQPASLLSPDAALPEPALVEGDDPIYRAMASFVPQRESKALARPRINILMLSGGGGWGAFGAGFLRTLHDRPAAPTFQIVTGVSTGALQALLVAADDYPALEQQYMIESEEELAHRVDYLDVVKKGYRFDTDPLRQRLARLLCTGPGICPMLEKIARNTDLRMFIGMVEASSGAFKAIDISGLARSAYPAAGPARKDQIARVAQCVVGVAMASAAVPVFQRPVRLRTGPNNQYKTYLDGGVRYSLFEARIAQLAAAMQAPATAAAGGGAGGGVGGGVGGADVTLYAIRNGPTVVRPATPSPEGGPAGVDAKPDAGAVALRAYSTIVNQNELMSIAGLRLLDPTGLINVATADGYASKASEKCVKTGGEDTLFDPLFMKCLVRWGREKAATVPWISLSPLVPAPREAALRADRDQ